MSKRNKPKLKPQIGKQVEVSLIRFPDKAFEIRYFATPIERDRSKKGARIRFPHIRPHSVCVFAIGCMWEPACWQKVVDMVAHTNKHGVCCWLNEIRDNCVQIPYAALNTMKDTACMWAHDQGFEYIMLIDNDILPEPDLVLRLINWDMPIVVPYVRDKKDPEQAKKFLERSNTAAEAAYKKTGDKESYEKAMAYAKDIFENGAPIANPSWEANTGLKPMVWAALSCILISCKVLNCFPQCAPFGNVNIESGFYNKLMHYGHKIWQDTNCELKVAKRPTFPADYGTLPKLWKFWEQVDVKRRAEPNRKPIDPSDKRDVYLPKEWGITIKDLEDGESGIDWTRHENGTRTLGT